MKILRERVLTAGSRGLSDAEILALILHDGTDSLSAVELAEKLLAEFDPATEFGVSTARCGRAASVGSAVSVGSSASAPLAGSGRGSDSSGGSVRSSVGSSGSGSVAGSAGGSVAGSALAALAAADVGRVRQTAGCGAVRAVTIAAAAEFARRVCAARGGEVSAIASKEDVLRMFALLADLPHEEFWVLYLTSAGRVIDRAKVSQGGVGGTVVDYRLVVKRALELLASGLVLVHNHPSGAATPSDDDIAVTDRITAAAALFDITVIDHLVLSREGSFSFAENFPPR